MQKLNERLSALRKQAGFTQQQLADLLNVSNKTISQWETGRTLPDITMLVRLSEIYEMKLDELLDQKGQTSIPNDALIEILLTNKYKDKLLIIYGLQLCGLILFFGIYFYLHHFSIPYAIKLVFDCISSFLAIHVYRSSQRYQVSRSAAQLNLFNICCVLLISHLVIIPCSNTFLRLFINDPHAYLYPNLYLNFSQYIQLFPLVLTLIICIQLLLHSLRVIVTHRTLNHRIVKLLLAFILVVGGSYGVYNAYINKVDTQTFTYQNNYNAFKQKYEWLVYVHDLGTTDFTSIDPTSMDKVLNNERVEGYKGIVGFDDDKLCVYKIDREAKISKWQPILYVVFLICDGMSMIFLLRFYRKAQL